MIVHYRCLECDSDEIQLQMWVNPNTNEIIEDVGGEEAWCDYCEKLVKLSQDEPEW